MKTTSTNKKINWDLFRNTLKKTVNFSACLKIIADDEIIVKKIDQRGNDNI